MAYIIVKDLEAEEGKVFFYRTWLMSVLHVIFRGGTMYKTEITEDK